MTVFQTDAGIIETARVRLSGTTATDIVTAGNKGATVEAIIVTNTGTGTPDITIGVLDAAGTTTYVIVQELSLAAKSAESTELGVPKSIFVWNVAEVLQASEKLQVTSTVGSNAVHVRALITRPT